MGHSIIILLKIKDPSSALKYVFYMKSLIIIFFFNNSGLPHNQGYGFWKISDFDKLFPKGQIRVD